MQALKCLRNIIDSKNNRPINYFCRKPSVLMSIAFNNRTTDMILTAFQG